MFLLASAAKLSPITQPRALLSLVISAEQVDYPSEVTLLSSVVNNYQEKCMLH